MNLQPNPLGLPASDFNFLTFDSYQLVARSTVVRGATVAGTDIPLFDAIHAGLGLCSEAGEVADALKRLQAYGKPLDLVNLKEEAGDCLWYISLLCDAAGCTLQEAAEANARKLALRKAQGMGATVNKDERDFPAERAALEGTCASHA